MKQISATLLLLLVITSLEAQIRRPSPDLFAVDANHRSSGFLVGLGLSTMWGQKDFQTTIDILPRAEQISAYRAEFAPSGRIGLHAELGMFWLFESSFFDYVDVSLAYKQHLGDEAMTAELIPGSADSLPNLLAGNGTFTQDQATLNVNLNKAFPVRGNYYIISALGADIDYRVINKAEYTLIAPGFNTVAPDNALSAHFHARLGIGYKTSASSWLSLTAETPIQDIVPFDGIQSRKTVFNSKYRPVLFTLRYQWLRMRAARECPTGPKKVNKKKKRRGGGSKDGQVH